MTGSECALGSRFAKRLAGCPLVTINRWQCGVCTGSGRERERERDIEIEIEIEIERESARGGKQIPKAMMYERFVVGKGLYESSRAVNMGDGLPRASSLVHQGGLRVLQLGGVSTVAG